MRLRLTFKNPQVKAILAAISDDATRRVFLEACVLHLVNDPVARAPYQAYFSSDPAIHTGSASSMAPAPAPHGPDTEPAEGSSLDFMGDFQS